MYEGNAGQNALPPLVRVGRVTAVDNAKRLAQVWYEDMKISSGWLPVLITRDYIPDYSSPPQTGDGVKENGEPFLPEHVHRLQIKPYMPKVNEQVLTLYEPIPDGMGFILGGIQSWQ